jgi:hypothetical protein
MGLTWNNIPCLWNEIKSLWNSAWQCGQPVAPGGGDDGYVPPYLQKKLRLIHVKVEQFTEGSLSYGTSGYYSGILSKQKGEIHVALNNIKDSSEESKKSIQIRDINDQ